MKLYEIGQIANETGVYAERGYNLNNFAKRIIELDRQQRQWVNLTSAEIGEIYRVGWANNMELARAIEAKLKEKNVGTL